MKKVLMVLVMIAPLWLLCGCDATKQGFVDGCNKSLRKVNREVEEKVLTDRLVSAIIEVESGGDPDAVSPVGARGLMQIMEPTWNWVCRDVMNPPVNWKWSEAFDPEKNRAVGEAYVKWLKKYWKKNGAKLTGGMTQMDAVIASYNGGQGRVMKSKGNVNKLPKETRKYLAKVKARM